MENGEDWLDVVEKIRNCPNLKEASEYLAREIDDYLRFIQCMGGLG